MPRIVNSFLFLWHEGREGEGRELRYGDIIPPTYPASEFLANASGTDPTPPFAFNDALLKEWARKQHGRQQQRPDDLHRRWRPVSQQPEGFRGADPAPIPVREHGESDERT